MLLIIHIFIGLSIFGQTSAELMKLIFGAKLRMFGGVNAKVRTYLTPTTLSKPQFPSMATKKSEILSDGAKWVVFA